MLRNVEDRLEVIPICFFEAPKEILLECGNFLVRDTWIKKEASRSSSVPSSEPQANSPRVEKVMNKSENLPPNSPGRERNFNSRTFHLSAYTNSDIAAKRNLAIESAKKDSSYSNGKGPTKQANVPPAKASTSGRGRGGNNNQVTGSGEDKKCNQGVLPYSCSKHLLDRVNKEESIDCVDPTCN